MRFRITIPFRAEARALENGEALDQEEEHQTRAGEDAEAEDELAEVGDVDRVRGTEVADDPGIDAVHHQAHEGAEAAEREEAAGATERGDREDRDGDHRLEKDLGEEEVALPGAIGAEDVAPLVMQREVDDPEREERAEEDRGDRGDAGEELQLELRAVEEAEQEHEEHEDRHPRAHRGDEELRGDPGGVPERMQARRRDQEERAERRVVHRGQGHAQHHERQHDLVQEVGDLREGEALGEDREQLEGGDAPVDGDAPEHLEEEAVRVPHEEGVPTPVRKPDVEDEREQRRPVAEEADQHRQPRHGVVLLQAEDVDHRRDHEAAGGERGARDHVEDLPQSPGETVEHVRGGTEAKDEAGEAHHRAGERQHPQHLLDALEYEGAAH